MRRMRDRSKRRMDKSMECFNPKKRKRKRNKHSHSSLLHLSPHSNDSTILLLPQLSLHPRNLLSSSLLRINQHLSHLLLLLLMVLLHLDEQQLRTL